MKFVYQCLYHSWLNDISFFLWPGEAFLGRLPSPRLCPPSAVLPRWHLWPRGHRVGNLSIRIEHLFRTGFTMVYLLGVLTPLKGINWMLRWYDWYVVAKQVIYIYIFVLHAFLIPLVFHTFLLIVSQMPWQDHFRISAAYTFHSSPIFSYLC